VYKLQRSLLNNFPLLVIM